MEKTHVLNQALLQEIDSTFTDLCKEIGNNRQQLLTKVLNIHKDLHKEVSKNKLDAERQKEIRAEVVRTVKMAANQLPHLRSKTPAPAKVAPEVSKPKAAIAATPDKKKAAKKVVTKKK